MAAAVAPAPGIGDDDLRRGARVEGMKTRGLSILGVLKSVRTLHGDAGYDKTVSHMTGDVVDLVRDSTLLSTAWYPIAYYQEVHAAAQRATHRGPQLARELSREATLADFRGIYRLLTFVLSPEGILRKAPGTWSRYYDQGRLEVGEARPRFATAHFSGCTGFDRSLWEDSIGGCIGVLEACGAKDVLVNIARGGRTGDDSMSIEVRWRT